MKNNTSENDIKYKKLSKVRVWKNDNFNDCYTIMINDNNVNYIFAMNDMPFHPTFGFSQFCGENYLPNKEWGNEISLSELNTDVINAILQRI